MSLMQLPIVSKTYDSEGMIGGNISVSYWYEASERDGQGKGGVGLFISISGPDDFSGERSAKFMWDSYLEEYLYSEGTVGDVLRKAVKAAQQRLVDLIQHERGVSEQGVDVHICACAIVDGSVSVILMGEPGVVLARDGKTIDLTEIVPSFSGQGLREEISVGTFALKSGDTLIVSTPKLVQSFLGTLEDEEGNIAHPFIWRAITEDLEAFSQNLVGNQYLWVLGYDVKEEVQNALEEVSGEASEGQEVPLDTGVSDVDVETDEGSEVAENIEPKTPLYTPRGIRNEGEGRIFAEVPEQEGFKGKVAGLARKTAVTVSAVTGRFGLGEKLKSVFDRIRQPEFFKRVRRAVGARVSALKMRGFTQRRMVIGQKGNLLTRLMKSKVALLIVFLVLAGLMGLYIVKQAQEKKRIEEIDTKLDGIESDIDQTQLGWEAEQNRVTTTDELVSLSDELAGLADSTLLTEQQSKKKDLAAKIQSVYDQMDRVTPISESNGSVEILTDLYLKIGEGADVTDFEKYGADLYIVDKASHAIYTYSPGQDSIKVVANSAEVLKSPEYIAIGDGYLFVYDSEVGIVMLDMNQNEPEWIFKIRPELSARTIGEVTEIAAFIDNVYILKKDEARVLKSYPAGAGYSFPEEYFRNGGFDKGVDILIDGNIYVYSNSIEKVYKYFGGRQDTFSINGLNVPLGDLCCGSTNMNDTGKLYIYDISNTRILSLEKPTADKHPGIAVLVKQYVYRGTRDDLFKDVKEIVVDIDERVMYVLDGTRILQVSLDND